MQSFRTPSLSFSLRPAVEKEEKIPFSLSGTFFSFFFYFFFLCVCVCVCVCSCWREMWCKGKEQGAAPCFKSSAYLCLLSIVLGRELQTFLPVVALRRDGIAADVGTRVSKKTRKKKSHKLASARRLARKGEGKTKKKINSKMRYVPHQVYEPELCAS